MLPPANVWDNEALASLLQRTRAQHALPPLQDPASIVAFCPEVFQTLSAGLPLGSLVQSGVLAEGALASTPSRNSRIPSTRPTRHEISFYVRQLDTTSLDIDAILNDFAQAHPVQQEFVDELLARPAELRRYIRYIGMCVDGQPVQRLEQDIQTAERQRFPQTPAQAQAPSQVASASSSTPATAATAVATEAPPTASSSPRPSNGNTSRLINFTAGYAIGAERHTFDVVPLKFIVDGYDAMPLDELMHGCCEGEQLAAPLPVRVTKTMVAKKANAQIAPIEAALIDCCAFGGVSLNSSIYGGLDTLKPIAIPPQAEALKAKVGDFCGPFQPAEGPLDRDLFQVQLDLVEATTKKLGGKLPSSHIRRAVALYASDRYEVSMFSRT